MKRLTINESQMKNKTNGGGFDNQAKHVREIHSRTLMEAFNNKTDFILINFAIRMLFYIEYHLHPIRFYEGSGGTSSQVPLQIKALNSSDIARCHKGSLMA